jgi:hypothetical protein
MSFHDLWTGSKSQLRRLMSIWETKLSETEKRDETAIELKAMEELLEIIDSSEESESEDTCTVILSVDTYPTLNDVMSYLYKNKMDTILHINECDVIRCITENGRHYVGYGCYYDLDMLFGAYSKYATSRSTIKISEMQPDKLYGKINMSSVSDTRTIITEYRYFCGYVFYLLYFRGDYGHRIFQIVNGDGNWTVNFIRIEGEPDRCGSNIEL